MCKCNDCKREEVLERNAQNRVGNLWTLQLWIFYADFKQNDFFNWLQWFDDVEKEEGGGQEQRDEPDADEGKGWPQFHAGVLSWVNDHLEAVESDSSDAYCRHEDVHSRKHRQELAHKRSKLPWRPEDLEEVEWQREETECEVGEGKIEDKDVAWSAHVRIAHDHVGHKSISKQTNENETNKNWYEHSLNDVIKTLTTDLLKNAF